MASAIQGLQSSLFVLQLLVVQLLGWQLLLVWAGYGCTRTGEKCCLSGASCSGMAKCPSDAKRASWMYGCKGESWHSDRLPVDWSYAGFAAGERQIPWKSQSVDIKALGAKGDGKTDDTWALQKAVDNAQPGTAIFFPPGKYVITKQLDIRKAVVLRGAGKYKTTLYFPKSLADVYGRHGGWGHGTCFINFWGWNPVNFQTRLASITGGAAKGSNKLWLDNTRGLSKGQWVRVVLSDSGENFKANLMGGLMDPGWNNGGARNVVRFTSRITDVNPSGYIILERKLPWEVKTQWSPSLHAVRPLLNEVGVEALTFEFPWTRYNGHLKENGFNALKFNQLANSWVRDVRFLNADTAIYWWGVTFSTVTGVEIDTTKPRGAWTKDWWSGLDKNGHRAIWSEFGESNLFTNIGVKAPFVHDFTVATAEMGSVWSNSWGTDLNLDFHKGAPYANLYTNLDMGAGTRPFRSGGGAGAGPNSASYQTFWNLKSRGPLQLPDGGFGPQINFIGVWTRESASARVNLRWLQDWGQYPQDLWSSMRQRRLGW